MPDSSESGHPQPDVEIGSHVHPEPSPDLIRERAYDIFLSRGQVPGNDLDDWLRAERELRIEMSAVHCRTCQENR